MTKVLVTGAKGMLGQDLCPILEDCGYDVVETTRNNLDITNFKNVDIVLTQEKPDIVIHCAAYTNVDGAESDLDTARLVNKIGTENIAKVCKKIDATMLYVSTDYVFNGRGSQPYKTDDTVEPLNNYGLTKLEGENSVKENLEKYYICRTSWLYGHHGKNFVETMLRLAGTKPELACVSEPSRAESKDTGFATIKVVDDQVGCPTWTVDLSNAIIKIIEGKPYGIYHTCGNGFVSWYGFAKEIFDIAGKNVNLVPCTTQDFPRPAKRPKYSVMDNGGICRNWKLALKDYMALRIDEEE